MPDLVDRNGEKVGTITFTPRRLELIKKTLGVDVLLLMESDELAKRMSTEPWLVTGIVYLSLDERPTCSIDEFGDRFIGDSLAALMDAFMEAFIAFFPKSRRPLLQKVKTAGERLVATQMEKAEAEADALLQLSSGSGSGELPASLESTQAT